MNTARTAYIDFLRALAILIMLMANISPVFFNPETPILLRMIYSMAAPIFVFLAGYSAFTFSSSNGNFAFWRVLFAAVLLDICVWHYFPFNSFDVLYTTALVVASVPLFKKIPAYFQHLSFLVLLTLWILSLLYYPYRFELSDPHHFNIADSLKRWLFDGWFPILPWILTGWVGAYFAKFKLIEKTWIKWSGLALFIGGAGLIYYQPLNPAREGYLEIFYPVTFKFLFFSWGLITLLLFVISTEKDLISKNNLLCVIGRNSLFAYILHCVFIAFVIGKIEIENTVSNMLLTWLSLTVVIFMLCYAREKFIPKSAELPKWLRLLTGI